MELDGERAEIVDGEGEDVPPVDISLPDQCPQFGEEPFRVGALRRHRLDAEFLPHVLPRGAADEHRQPPLALADEVEAGLHAGQHAPGVQIEVDVLDRPFHRPARAHQPAARGHEEVGQAEAHILLLL